MSMQQDNQDENNPNLILRLTSGNVLVSDGSLAQKCAKELHKLYLKEEHECLHVGMESQALDLSESVGVWQALVSSNTQVASPGETQGLVYGVGASDAKMSDYIKISDALNTMSADGRKISAVVIEPDRCVAENPWVNAIHDLADEYGVRVLQDVRHYLQESSS
jgi:hypothetical protein